MELKIDTNDLVDYARTHMRVVIPSGLWALSYIFAKNVDCGCTFINVFFGALTVLTFILAAITSISVIGRILDWDLS